VRHARHAEAKIWISSRRIPMALSVAVQMDPIDKINIAGDSTFALLLEARTRRYRLYYYTPDKLSLRDGRVRAEAAPVDVRDVEGDHFTLGEEARLDLSSMDVVLLRQDPPFDIAYITSTHLLEHLQPEVLVVNDPASVRNAPEKLFVMNFPNLMPPTLITRSKSEIEAFLDEHGEAVMKPLHGHGGAAVFKISRKDRNFASLFDLFAASFREPWVVQRFLPQVVHGDKRIILVDGKPLGALNRVPSENDIRANMARGGSAGPAELTLREREICTIIGPELKRRGLLFAGIDVIDGHLTEINVTSPTGIRAIKQLGGPDLAIAIWDAIEAKSRIGKALPFTETAPKSGSLAEETRRPRPSPSNRNQ
jgi:glutathione synthase